MGESDNPIFRIADRAAALRAEGVDVITLAAGEPESPTADHIVQAAIDAARDPRTHHYGPAAGQPELRSRIAQDHPDVTEDHVQVAVGTKHALHLALAAVAGPGDEVLVLRPRWPGHVGAVESVGAVVADLATGADGLVDLAELERAGTPRTRALVVANPSNPSGALHPPEQMRAVAQWCLRHGIWLISDEVYGGLVYEREPFSATSVIADRSRLIVVDGVSKVHAMTGWRVGWLIGPRDVIGEARRRVSATITQVPALTQQAALAALDPPIADGLAETARARAVYRASRDMLVSGLREVPGVRCAVPAGGMFAFPDVTGLLRGRESSANLAARLLDDAHVAVVPGEVFDAPRHLRIGFAVAPARLRVATTRLVAALEPGRT